MGLKVMNDLFYKTYKIKTDFVTKLTQNQFINLLE